MKIGVPKESFPGERRVALVPSLIPILKKNGFEISIEAQAGKEAGYPDQQYKDKGAEICASRDEIFQNNDIILQVRGLGANPQEGRLELALYRSGMSIIAFQEPLSEPKIIHEMAQTQACIFSMELMPRITKAQSMDSLSSMATIAGYKAALMAADHLPKMFPMMITAAGTITPAKVFVIGAGVAGLQAIASSRRMGAVLHAYDVRPAVKEQVESLGAKFVELELDAAESETTGGYAKEMREDFYKKQQEMMTKVVGESDVVITTAAIPGKKAPILITKEMVAHMMPGSIIVDLAAERGGNCEITKPGETVVTHGVTVLGPLNLPSTIPYHASQMYAKNITTFVLHLFKDSEELNIEDEITKETLF